MFLTFGFSRKQSLPGGGPWGRRTSPQATRKRVVARRVFMPRLEALEDRTVLSTFLVTNLNDSGSGSLRDATAGKQVGESRAGGTRPDDDDVSDRHDATPFGLGTITVPALLPNDRLQPHASAAKRVGCKPELGGLCL